MMKHEKISFIGGGNMAKSLISGMIQSNYPQSLITVSTPHQDKVNLLVEKFKINGTTDNSLAATNSDIIVLAIKPQMMQQVLTEMSSSINNFSDKLIISVMAGVTVNRICQMLPGCSKVIRVMPNTPALIGLGMAGLYASKECSVNDKTFADELLKSCGKTAWVQNEASIDDITAISGSAPAYFFLFMECIANKAKTMGFSEADTRTIIEQVALGSANMVIKNQEKSISELRAAVTSKGGTTFEAIKVFEDKKLNEIVEKAIDACKNRATEMATQF
jgi:pyrroline-5-carboxylate reductase